MRTDSLAVLGVGGSDHDVNACIVRDGRVMVAIEEERISRRKYGIGGNLTLGLARNYCLDVVGSTLAEVGDIVVDSILPPTAALAYRHRAKAVDHHLAHAAMSFFTSGFDSAAVLVVDNAGDLVGTNGDSHLQATSWYRARGREIEFLGGVGSTGWKEGRLVRGVPYQRGDGDHSLGHFYKKATGALGFRFPHGQPASDYYFPEDGITMGLAAYGDKRYEEEIRSFVELLPDGRYRAVLNDGRMDATLGRLLDGADFERRAAVAAAFQEVLTEALCHIIEHVLTITGETSLCLGGGVAMNSVANGEILRRTRVERLYIPPVPGDNGTGVGAAIWTVTRNADNPVPAYSVYGGKPWSAAEVNDAVSILDPKRYDVRVGDGLIAEVADRLAAGQILAWFESGSENGRRALGHRSILADPRRAETRDHLNYKVKKRQPFRPFAPIVIEERAAEFFEIGQPSPYMQIVFRVREEWREKLAAITHVDGTARVQTLNRHELPRLHELLTQFERRAGVPVILNTSFNGSGEPIVETPREAVCALERMPLDGLVFEDRIVIRK